MMRSPREPPASKSHAWTASQGAGPSRPCGPITWRPWGSLKKKVAGSGIEKERNTHLPGDLHRPRVCVTYIHTYAYIHKYIYIYII